MAGAEGTLSGYFAASHRAAAIRTRRRKRWRCSTLFMRWTGRACARRWRRKSSGRAKSPTLFVEINTGAEPQKAGVLPEHADEFCAPAGRPMVSMSQGLMCIPPHEEAPAPHFALTAKSRRATG